MFQDTRSQHYQSLTIWVSVKVSMNENAHVKFLSRILKRSSVKHLVAIYNPPIVLNFGFGGFVKRGLVEGIKSLLTTYNNYELRRSGE